MTESQPSFATSVQPPVVIEPVIEPLIVSSQAAAVPRRNHAAYPTVLDTGRPLLSIIVVALFVLTFIVQPFRIPSESMEHTLLVGDFLLVNKMIYSPKGIWRWLLPYRQIQRGDIVVFHFPLDPTDHVVKRVIAVPGDHACSFPTLLAVGDKNSDVTSTVSLPPFTTFAATVAMQFGVTTSRHAPGPAPSIRA